MEKLDVSLELEVSIKHNEMRQGRRCQSVNGGGEEEEGVAVVRARFVAEVLLQGVDHILHLLTQGFKVHVLQLQKHSDVLLVGHPFCVEARST